ncbi:MAG: hypothetical protein LBI54_01495 [Lachnospiraceae bacterium]|jgi:hypothetical protein|nr:hypothetical protein [Lachnospiraceae bacterium]
MLFTLLSWLYIGTTSFLCGFALFRLVDRYSQPASAETPREGLDLYLLLGLCAITAYAQIFSLFYKVGLLANLILVLVCVVIFVCQYRQIKQYAGYIAGFAKKPYVWLAALFFGLLLLVITSGRAYHYDTAMYHAQTIHWLEEYGIVPGLGNLYSRLALNSSFFCLQALYSLKFLTGQSMHSLNGFIVAVMLIYASVTLWLPNKRVLYRRTESFSVLRLRRRRPRSGNYLVRRRVHPRYTGKRNIIPFSSIATSDFIKGGFFLFFILGGVHYDAASPGTDTSTQFMLLYLAAKWSENIEGTSKNPFRRIPAQLPPYCVKPPQRATSTLRRFSLYDEICTRNAHEKVYGSPLERKTERGLTSSVILGILAVWVLTLKLSGLVLLFFAAYLAVALIMEKKGKMLAVFFLACVVVLAPFLIRNVIVSGYLAYPLYWLDIFNVDWKMPLEAVKYESDEIRAWGRGMTNSADYHAPLSVWLPVWLAQFTRYGRLLLGANIICLALAPGLLLRALIKRESKAMVLLFVSVAGLVFWFVSAPLLRYGYVYMILLPAVVAGHGLALARQKTGIKQGAARLLAHRGWRRALSGLGVGLGLLALGKLCLIGAGAAPRYWPPPLIRQADYDPASARTAEWQGLTIYIPEEGYGWLGYHNFPGAPSAGAMEHLALRTGEIAGGFKYLP